MKIVSVLTSNANGGAEFAVVELLETLAERGHQTVLITNHDQLPRGLKTQLLTIDLGPKLSRRNWPALLMQSPFLSSRLRAILKKEWPYDILLLHFKKEQLLARGLPNQLRAHTVWAEWGPIPSQFRKGIPQQLFLNASKHVRLICAVSENTKNSLVEAGISAEKVAVLPNALQTTEINFCSEGRKRIRQQLGINDHTFLVGCISRFNSKKRNDVVIEAVKQLEANIHLLLAGNGETETELRKNSAPLGDRIHFLPTPKSEIADVLSACDLMVFCPSPTEGAPRAVILALLTQRPCIATDSEGVSSLLKDGIGQIISPPNDPIALAEAITAYASDPDRLATEGSLARQYATAAYDTSVVGQLAEDLFVQAVPNE